MLNAPVHFKKTELLFSERFDHVSLSRDSTLLIYDVAFEKRAEKNPGVFQFIRSFPNRYSVSGGETLKEFQNLPDHLALILKQLGERPLKICGMGGGSVTDFTGFVAGLLKRGLPFDLIPTTWLSAVDSAHGGKNAMNVSGLKNQVGSFHFPDRVFLIEELLAEEPEPRFRDALSEVIKTQIISGLKINPPLTPDVLFKALPDLIREKMKIVEGDPFDELRDQKTPRAVLNLGHTFGHVLESALHLTHGQAVALGIRFSLEWSKNRGYFPSSKAYEDVLATLEVLPGRKDFNLPPLERGAVRRALTQDKKRVLEESLGDSPDATLYFIFIRGMGIVSVERVRVLEVLRELEIQGWLRSSG